MNPSYISSAAFQEIYVQGFLINHLFICVCHSESAHSGRKGGGVSEGGQGKVG